VDEITIALKGLPNDSELWWWVGIAQFTLGNFEEALAAYERGAQLNPRNADLHFRLGAQINRIVRRYADAVRAYDRALSLAPELHVIATDRAWTYVLWQGQVDTLRAVLDRLPKDADLGVFGGMANQRAQVFLLERNAGGLLQMLESIGPDDLVGPGTPPRLLYVAWAHRLRGERAAARTAFDSACVLLDARVRAHPDDYAVHTLRGLALAGLGRREAALNEARWLQSSSIRRKNRWTEPVLAESRAQILAQAGEAEAALDEIERLLAKPSALSVHLLRLDPIWDPIREHPRFMALLKKYGSKAA
jgi:serine/threonine-protein kinase